MLAKFATNSGGITWWSNFELIQVLKWIQIQYSWKDNSSYKLYTLGPLCLWQCFLYPWLQSLTVLLDYDPRSLICFQECFHPVWDECKSQPHPPSSSSPLQLLTCTTFSFQTNFLQDRPHVSFRGHGIRWESVKRALHCIYQQADPILIGHIGAAKMCIVNFHCITASLLSEINLAPQISS